MSDGESPPDELTPAQGRLSEHLELLRANPPTPAGELMPRIIRTVRWQRAIRPPLVLVGVVASAISEGLSLLLNVPTGRS